MANILGGSLAQIISKAQIAIFIDASGNDLTTGSNIVNGSLAQIKAVAEYGYIVDENGNIIS